MIKKLHIALGVKNISQSIKDYTKRFGCDPVVVIDNSYALFTTETLNISIRHIDDDTIVLRHLGWESNQYTSFSKTTDCNGIVWETFNKNDQVNEILYTWPDAAKKNPYLKPSEGQYSQIPTLETDRLILRPLHPNDAQTIYEGWTSDEDVARFTSWKAHRSIDETRQFLAYVVNNYEQGRLDTWGIIDKSTKKLIGSAGYDPSSQKNGRCAIGYVLAKAYWNQGFMTEAIRKIVAHGVDALTPMRIEAHILSKNTASIRVLEKVGFQNEGCLRHYETHHGVPADIMMFSILPHEVILK